MNIFKRKNIKNRVMEIIEAKISEAQKDYDDDIKYIEEQLVADMNRIVTIANEKKMNLEDSYVEKLLNKII